MSRVGVGPRAGLAGLAGVAAVLLLAVAGLVGCGTVETHTAMLRSPGPAQPSGQVEIYLDDQDPGRLVEELGFVQAYGSGAKATPEDVARALAERAAELGCDAVVRVSIDVGYTRAHAAGVCVKLVGPAPAGHTYTRPALVASPPPVRPPAPPGPQPRMEPLPSNQRM